MQKLSDETFCDIFNREGANIYSNVYSIEPNRNFLQELARVVLSQIRNDNFDLSDAVILLPTRRAARALELAFMETCQKDAVILPRIRTLGDIEPFEINLCEFEETDALPQTIAPMARKFALARLIRSRDGAAGWRDDARSALAAADALAELLDAGEMCASGEESAKWSKLADLNTSLDLAEHWQKSRDFLEIITKIWPQYLAEQNLCDASYKRRRAIEMLAKAWENNPPKHMVIIAGSTGAIPATQKLMKVVANLPKGAVVLPGLDMGLNDKAWRKIGEEDPHPQRAIYDTIGKIGVKRQDVKNWPQTSQTTDNLTLRRLVLNEALTPKEATADWLDRAIELGLDSEKLAQGLEGISIIEAQSEDEEASAIANLMRQSLETNGATCALITPNQDIARRVSAKMAKWEIRLDVSSGTSARETIIGSFFALVANWLCDPASPQNLMSLLAHPMASFGLERFTLTRAAASLEMALLRQSRKDATIGDMLLRAKVSNDKIWFYARANRENAVLLLEALDKFANEFAIEARAYNLEEAAELLLLAATKIASAHNLWKGEAGNTLSNFFAETIECGKDYFLKDADQAFDILMQLMRDVTIRPRGTHPRLAILGPLEARLLHFDKIILAGLDEGTWPAAPGIDPFLSRPMRKALGLQSKDLRIGLSAHDFAQFAASANVVLTRSARRGGAPSVPSRWLWRLKTLCAGVVGVKKAGQLLMGSDDALALVRADNPLQNFDLKSVIPSPRPPISARPVKFSATQIETFIRDPYKTYVQKILDLSPLDPLGGDISAKERGSAIHKALECVAKWDNNLSADYYEELRQSLRNQLINFGLCGHKLEQEMARLEPTISHIVPQEIQRIKEGWKIAVEQYIECKIETEKGDIIIHAKADRIDENANGSIEIWDFKTGTPPSNKQISALISPQLPVTAMIIEFNKTASQSDAKVSAFGHVQIGNSKPRTIKWNGTASRKDENGKYKIDVSLESLIADTHETICKLHESYQDPSMPYASKPRVQFNPKVNYEDQVDRLARRGEWANIGENSDDSNEYGNDYEE